MTGIHTLPYKQAPDILIGQDHSHLIVIHEFRAIISNSLLVSRCLLGWAIHGHLCKERVAQVNIVQPIGVKHKISVMIMN